ncbi:F0F1 ATP synthase subunit gamma [Candidatus Aalborgicola defluviihabitans]|jgi:F-type H+-transporting ATPase subunit gamma|uniref:F0F1 ATP synthase subunit gamma n=1 Tax=Candidatus Aalborgicola defluviihabitans TaxID=3386187 RepID=UPI001D936C87|nr:F0F1 ATP synthase subunit gamma [Burkholderiales bacterium]MBK7281321.1 F0F1 ATP synthase subunit gamma [Burkholderiales bacterium]MBK7314008.1 F0F1 ATP synthase subunit gamma [Burkholderiales bacterium]MBL0245015.1 F0F1 ATP synthase subunit gamma [Rhodoferax sp.]
MSGTIAELRRKIDSAGELQSVVRTMKAMAASSIGQYERAVQALEDYYRTVQLALSAGFRQMPTPLQDSGAQRGDRGKIVALVFGSDQGLVGQFNETLVEFTVTTLNAMPEDKTIWTIGERIQSRLAETPLPLDQRFALPISIDAITALVGQVLLALEAAREVGGVAQVFLFHNAPTAGSVYTPTVQRLLPLDEAWQHDLVALPWPTRNLPEVLQLGESALLAFVREYLFVSLFRTCAQSLASENASRLAAMQRAEKNIDELMDDLNRSFHRLRQNGIDEELFDLISGFEALAPNKPTPKEIPCV